MQVYSTLYSLEQIVVTYKSDPEPTELLCELGASLVSINFMYCSTNYTFNALRVQRLPPHYLDTW